MGVEEEEWTTFFISEIYSDSETALGLKLAIKNFSHWLIDLQPACWSDSVIWNKDWYNQ